MNFTVAKICYKILVWTKSYTIVSLGQFDLRPSSFTLIVWF